MELPASQAEIETAKTLTAIDELGRRARGEDTGFPTRSRPTGTLSPTFSAAELASTGGGVAGPVGRIGRRMLAWLLPSQIAYNQALVDVIHQLDHRDRQQREEIANLQQKVAALADAIDANDR
ncbi:MAG: hypothetical protein R2710_28215 [Acidimicrobiales bacterium]